LGFGSLAAPLLLVLARSRACLLLTGGGLVATAVAPVASVAVAPLALVGAAGTVVECASTEVLQRSVPDHVRAFSLGLTDTAIVLAAMVGALVAPRLVSLLGPVAVFVGLAALLVAMAGLNGVPNRSRFSRSPEGDTAASASRGRGRRR